MALVSPASSSPTLSFEPLAGPSSRPYVPPASPTVSNDPPLPGPPAPDVKTGSKPRPKRYKCQWDGCDKAYTKPSRLEEHEASHRGERTHICPTCGSSYLRQDHLRAHIRTHLNQEDRPYGCTRPGCDMRFWTTQHLRRHEEAHESFETHAVVCEHCSATFSKEKQLRDHIAAEHLPEGSHPFACPQEGCGASFANKRQLKNHSHTHDARYTCSDPLHPPLTFPNWSALQKHMHSAHPPTCPRPECNGRTFGSHAKLKAHEKVHRDREADLEAAGGPMEGPAGGAARAGESEDESEWGESGAELKMDAEADVEGADVSLESRHLQAGPSRAASGSGADGEEPQKEKRTRKRKRDILAALEAEAGAASPLSAGKSPKLVRVKDGEAGKIYACGRQGCGKKFKTKYALTTHTRATHLAIRHSCPAAGCDASFSHMCTLRRHLLSVHGDERIGGAGGPLSGPAASAVAGTAGQIELGFTGLEPEPETSNGAEIGGSATAPSAAMEPAGGDVVQPGTAPADRPIKRMRKRLECPAHLVFPTVASLPDAQSAASRDGQRQSAPLHPHAGSATGALSSDLRASSHAGTQLAAWPVAAVASASSDPTAPAHYPSAPDTAIAPQESNGGGLRCGARFWRVYDMRRHLRADHGVEVPDDELRALLASMPEVQGEEPGPEQRQLGRAEGQAAGGSDSIGAAGFGMGSPTAAGPEMGQATPGQAQGMSLGIGPGGAGWRAAMEGGRAAHRQGQHESLDRIQLVDDRVALPERRPDDRAVVKREPSPYGLPEGRALAAAPSQSDEATGIGAGAAPAADGGERVDASWTGGQVEHEQARSGAMQQEGMRAEERVVVKQEPEF